VSACAHADGFERRDKLANKVIKIIKMLNKGEDGGERYKGLGGTSGSWEMATGCWARKRRAERGRWVVGGLSVPWELGGLRGALAPLPHCGPPSPRGRLPLHHPLPAPARHGIPCRGGLG